MKQYYLQEEGETLEQTKEAHYVDGIKGNGFDDLAVAIRQGHDLYGGRCVVIDSDGNRCYPIVLTAPRED